MEGAKADPDAPNPTAGQVQQPNGNCLRKTLRPSAHFAVASNRVRGYRLKWLTRGMEAWGLDNLKEVLQCFGDLAPCVESGRHGVGIYEKWHVSYHVGKKQKAPQDWGNDFTYAWCVFAELTAGKSDYGISVLEGVRAERHELGNGGPKMFHELISADIRRAIRLEKGLQKEGKGALAVASKPPKHHVEAAEKETTEKVTKKVDKH